MIILFAFLASFITQTNLPSLNDSISAKDIKHVIYNSIKYLDENVSVNGGYVWYYKTNLSRRWGELEAYPSMIWVQGGTVDMGNLFLDVYDVTEDEYYYNLAKKSALALIKGQLECGGWNYFIDFAGDSSTKKWYSTIGANAWRLEEFHQYYGNATFDDNVTAGAAKFLLRIYLIKKDSIIKKSLDKAIEFILKSQYPNGAWPQRFPFIKNRNDYTRYYTFNDNVIWNNIKFLILCYATLKYEKLLEPIKRGMNFFILSQYKKPQAGWAQQYDLKLQPARARTYEPAALDPQYTARHIEMLIKFYEMTGDKKYLNAIPDALQWVKSVVINNKDSLALVPKFVELRTNKPIYLHRKGSNLKFGSYYFDYCDSNIVIHYPCTRLINLQSIERQYKNALQKQINNKKANYLNLPESNDILNLYYLIDDFLQLPSDNFMINNRNKITSEIVNNIISKMDNHSRWLTEEVFISNPFIDGEISGDSETKSYSISYVGDKFDTSPFPNNTNEKFISIREYIKNIKILLNYIKRTL
ncbi:pectate lyase [Rosettibacter firmus]|uniref:pectate lyase n=1 Tax=Rosettibacter firmus TaxID=3111522 RepID=UPI00336BEFB7